MSRVPGYNNYSRFAVGICEIWMVKDETSTSGDMDLEQSSWVGLIHAHNLDMWLVQGMPKPKADMLVLRRIWTLAASQERELKAKVSLIFLRQMTSFKICVNVFQTSHLQKQLELLWRMTGLMCLFFLYVWHCRRGIEPCLHLDTGYHESLRGLVCSFWFAFCSLRQIANFSVAKSDTMTEITWNYAPRDEDVVVVESDAEITRVTPSVLCVGVVHAGVHKWIFSGIHFLNLLTI